MDVTGEKKCSDNSIGYIEGSYDTEVIFKLLRYAPSFVLSNFY